jgi:hypothetical protein
MVPLSHASGTTRQYAIDVASSITTSGGMIRWKRRA